MAIDIQQYEVMDRVRTTSELSEIVQRIKRPGEPFCTNYFIQPADAQRLIDQGRMFQQVMDRVAYLLIQEDDFLRLHFISRGEQPIADTLHALSLDGQHAVVVDIPGRRDDTESISRCFRSSGFRPYAVFQRMSRVVGSDVATEMSDPDIVFAQIEEAPLVHQMLCHQFDKYSEHLPTCQDIETSIHQQAILVARIDGRIGGLLYFERFGVSTMLRYWLVEEAFRGHRLGARLMHRYFNECRNARRFMLWVDMANHNAILRYQHYGYASDGTLDNIFIINENGARPCQASLPIS